MGVENALNTLVQLSICMQMTRTSVEEEYAELETVKRLEKECEEQGKSAKQYPKREVQPLNTF